MRRSSYTPAYSNAAQEPLIVVEESDTGEGEDEDNEQEKPTSPKFLNQSMEMDSPVNPYLLSPWRDPRETRKHSLPTLQCTDGITASQVRRLSERGEEGLGLSQREQEFLATLSQAPCPQRGGRRHSVVTISRVPTAMFGRNRRDSIGVASGLSSRRESITASIDTRGSIHNLQLDIMDDIVTARKSRMKLWGNDKTAESVDKPDVEQEASTSSRNTGRRYSDFVGNMNASLPPIQSFRRGSENPSCIKPPPVPAK